jgi:hypothetical protein
MVGRERFELSTYGLSVFVSGFDSSFWSAFFDACTATQTCHQIDGAGLPKVAALHGMHPTDPVPTTLQGTPRVSK